MNDIYVTGMQKIDVADNIWYVDCFASGEAADWLDDNLVTTGTLFEGKFKLVYELVEKGGGSRGTIAAVDTKIANIVLLKGIKVIEHDSPTRLSKASKKVKGLDDLLSSGLGSILMAQSDDE